MKRTLIVAAAMAMIPACVFGVDGVVLINQATVMAAGGFPYTISQPGSYRLSGNLTVPDANTTAIFMNNDNITLDLNGFNILGPTVCVGVPVTSCSPTGTGYGVDFGRRRNISVRNGSVRGMGSVGIAGDDGSTGGQVENIHADSNGGLGIIIGYGKVTGNTATGNGQVGVLAANSVVTGNTATLNATDGFVVLDSTANGNVSSRNGRAGFNAGGGLVSGNTATLNGSNGFNVECATLVTGNTATNNASQNLITFGTGCLLFANVAP
jgi:hypothetical protein